MSLFPQTPTVKHVVERGETLEDIANNYGVTTDDIISLNPSAAQFVYVGMELTIPVKEKVKQTSVNNIPNNQSSKSNSNYNKTEPSNSQNNTYNQHSSSEESKWGAQMELGYGFLKGKSNHAYEATIGGVYNITPNFYAGARIGYNSATYSYSEREGGDYVNSTATYHLLRIPLEAGYKFYTENKKLGIIPFAGFGFNIGLSGKQEYNTNLPEVNDQKAKIGGKIGIDVFVGVRVSLWGFLVSGGYHLPLNDNQKGYFGKDAYPLVSIGWIL